MDKFNAMDYVVKLDNLCPGGYTVALNCSFAGPKYLLTSYPKKWQREYSEKGYLGCDPAFQWAVLNRGRIHWNELEKIDEKAVLAAAKEYGLNFGFTISFMYDSTLNFVNAARRDRNYTSEEIDRIYDEVVGLVNAVSESDGFSEDDVAFLTRLSVTLTH